MRNATPAVVLDARSEAVLWLVTLRGYAVTARRVSGDGGGGVVVVARPSDGSRPGVEAAAADLATAADRLARRLGIDVGGEG